MNTKRAEALLKEFGTPMRAFNAFLEYNPKKFPVGGIGEKTVSDIKKILSMNIANVRPRRMIEYEFRDGIRGLEEVLIRAEKDLGKKKIPVLKQLLRERGLKLGGKKDELVERLLMGMSEEERVDTKLFVKKYKELSKTKASLHQMPKNLESAYKRFKRSESK